MLAKARSPPPPLPPGPAPDPCPPPLQDSGARGRRLAKVGRRCDFLLKQGKREMGSRRLRDFSIKAALNSRLLASCGKPPIWSVWALICFWPDGLSRPQGAGRHPLRRTKEMERLGNMLMLEPSPPPAPALACMTASEKVTFQECVAPIRAPKIHF